MNGNFLKKNLPRAQMTSDIHLSPFVLADLAIKCGGSGSSSRQHYGGGGIVVSVGDCGKLLFNTKVT